MGFRLCQLCGFAWDNHGTLCPGSIRVFTKTPAADPRDARIAELTAANAALVAECERLRTKFKRAQEAWKNAKADIYGGVPS